MAPKRSLAGQPWRLFLYIFANITLKRVFRVHNQLGRLHIIHFSYLAFVWAQSSTVTVAGRVRHLDLVIVGFGFFFFQLAAHVERHTELVLGAVAVAYDLQAARKAKRTHLAMIKCSGLVVECQIWRQLALLYFPQLVLEHLQLGPDRSVNRQAAVCLLQHKGVGCLESHAPFLNQVRQHDSRTQRQSTVTLDEDRPISCIYKSDGR